MDIPSMWTPRTLTPHTLIEQCRVSVQAPDTVEPCYPAQHWLQSALLLPCILHKLTEPLHRQILHPAHTHMQYIY